MNPYPFPREKLFVHPADWGKIEEPIIIDVLDHKAYFIAVAGEHDRGFAFSRALDQAKSISQHVGLHLIDVILDVLSKDLLDGLLVARGAGGFSEGF
jgi:hypothetical protein